MSKTTLFELDLLKLIFQGVAIPDLAENDASTPATNLYVSLHSATPDETGTQATNEVTVAQYNTYNRVPVARSAGGWLVADSGTGITTGVGTVKPAADIIFPACISGTGVTATHFGVGTSPTPTVAGYLLYKGTVTPNIPIAAGVTPRLTQATKIEED